MFENVINRYKSLIYALMAFFLFLAFQEQVKEVIDTCLLPVFSVSYHKALDAFAIMALVWMSMDVVQCMKKKSVIIGECAFTYWLIVAYVYYRFFDDTYSFLGFFNWNIAYLDAVACYLVARTFSSLLRQERVVWKEWFGEHKQKKGDSQTKTVYYDDKSIKDYKEDIFNLKEHVEGVLDFLDAMDVKNKACSVGLVGIWGSGKTSFFELMKQSLKKREEQSRNVDKTSEKKLEYLIVEFNPRSSKGLDKIQEDFLNALKDVLKKSHLDLTKVFEDYAEALDISTNTSPIIAFLIRIFHIHRKSRQESFDTINEVIRLTGKRVMVLVDDLDRLTGEELLEVMKVIDKNGAFSNVVFVSAYDKEYINGALKAYLHQNIDTYYTDKYFETEIHIPNHAFFKLREYMLKSLMRAHDMGMLRPDKNEIIRVITNCDSCMQKRLHSLRDVKRFINQLLFHYQGAKQGVAFHDYLLLQLIRYAHPEEYDKLRRNEYVEMLSPSKSFRGSQELLYLKNKMSKGELPESIDILNALFPSSGSNIESWYEHRFQRIYHIYSFDVYFYNYEYNHLLQTDFDSLYNVPLKEACEKLLGWKSFSKDLESYLFTRKLERFKTKDKLMRYFHLLLYGNYIYGGVNYRILSTSFLGKNNFEIIRAQYNFADRDAYLDWIQEALVALLDINSAIVVEFLQYLITNMIDEPTLEHLYEYSYSELQKVSVAILDDYLSRIEKEGWSSHDAFALSQVKGVRVGEIYNPAATSLRTSMKKYPEKYITGLMPVAVQIERTKICPERVKVSFVDRFIVKDIFTDVQEFEDWLNDSRLDGVGDVDLIRRFWALYSNNGCQPLIVEGIKPDTIEEVIRMIEESKA